MNPDRLSVVLAPKLQYYSASICSLLDRLERFLYPTLRVRSVGNERHAYRTRNFLRFDAQDVHGRTVGADETRIQTLLHIGDGRFFIQVPQSLFAFAQALLGAHAAQFGCRPGCKDLEQQHQPRVLRQRTLVEHRKVAEDFTTFFTDGNAEIAFDPQLFQRYVVWK